MTWKGTRRRWKTASTPTEYAALRDAAARSSPRLDEPDSGSLPRLLLGAPALAHDARQATWAYTGYTRQRETRSMSPANWTTIPGWRWSRLTG